VSDIRIITTTQGHWDHVGDLAEFKRVSGASVHISERDAPVLESGGHLDYRLPEGRGIIYAPIDVDRTLTDGDTIRLGDTELTAHAHPGHTQGSMSFSFSTRDDNRAYDVLVANMNSINAGVELLNSPGYPTIAEDFARTLAAQAPMTPDIWVSSHAGQFNLHEIYSPGDPYNSARFGDLSAYRAKVAGYQKAYDEQLAEERRAPAASR
jgi:metallo-beta-lactamase class B